MTQLRQFVLGAALFGALGAASAAQAGDWFQHKFGEMRSFHGDWLAVCDAQGEGPCRIVRAEADPGSDAFFDMRLAVLRIDGTPDWAIEVMDRDLPAEAVTELRFVFDGGQSIAVPGSAMKPGTYGSAGASDTLTIIDPQLVQTLLDHMIAGNHVQVYYAPEGSGNGTARFPLRGVTSAVNAIQSIVLPRQE